MNASEIKGNSSGDGRTQQLGSAAVVTSATPMDGNSLNTSEVNSTSLSPTPKLETGEGSTGVFKGQVAIPIISTTPATVITTSASSFPPLHLASGHLPLSTTASLLSNNVNRTTPINPRQSKRSVHDPSKNTSKRNFNKVNRKVSKRHQVLSVLNRPCQHHSFLTEVTDVQQMEQGLVQLLDDFHSGKLQAFGKDCSFERMDNVREQQERLARLHFDLGSQQETYGIASEEGRAIAKDHLTKLMTQLQELSLAIEQLQSSTSGTTNVQAET